jgi:glycosyltransferase involved in cell wall biosynthesis
VNYRFVAAGQAVSQRTVREVITAVSESAPDVIHLQGLDASRRLPRLARAARGIPIVVQDHGSSVPAGWRRLAHRWAFRSASGVIFTAKEQAEPWKRAGVFAAALPVFEAIEMSSAFTPGDRDQARVETGMFGNPCVLWTGRLDANKDPLTTLAAFEIAAEHLPDARLWCCYGEAPLLGEVRQRIARSATLRDRVTLLGTRPHAELELRFRAADFLVQCSGREGSGYSVIEALACGTTPLVTDIPSFRRIVGSAGSLTPVADAPALAAAIEDWSSRDRDTVRAQARAHFDDRLSFRTIGSELVNAYRTVSGSELASRDDATRPRSVSSVAAVS